MLLPKLASGGGGLILSLLVSLGLVVAESHAQERKKTYFSSGYWQMSETYATDSGEQNSVWSFELLDDGRPSVIAIGHKLESNGKRVKDRSIALVFIDKKEDGTLSGSYLETYGDGKQTELPIAIEVAPSSRELKLVISDAKGTALSTFEGEWIGNWAESSLQSGNWKIREIVSPVKGDYDIEWAFRLQEKGNKIYGTGNKFMVNGRQAYPGEVKTRCEISLERDDYRVIGKGVETNHLGKKSRVSYEGWVSPAGRAFFLMSQEKGKLSALLVGRCED